jgi:hypothetical protein
MSTMSRDKLLAVLHEIAMDSTFQGQLLTAADRAAQILKFDSEDKQQFHQVVIDEFRRLGEREASNAVRFAPNLLGWGDVDRLKAHAKTECAAAPGSLGAKARHLPPWGQIDEHQTWLSQHWQIPVKWGHGKEGANGACPQWRSWLDDVVGTIDTTLWPVYQPRGASMASPKVKRLLEADFELLSKLHSYISHGIKGSSSRATHARFFAEEDQGVCKVGSSYNVYDDTLDSHDLANMPNTLEDGSVLKVGTLHLQLKQIFQRPRPSQVAYILGMKTYKYLAAASANTPSLVSGHSLQGSIAGCHAFVDLRLNAQNKTHSRERMQQFTVDVGDRRVFAGVHYPSDNLASWITALKLVPHVFEPTVTPDVVAFLWEAITEKSDVYDAISTHVKSRGDSAYGPAIKALDELRP